MLNKKNNTEQMFGGGHLSTSKNKIKKIFPVISFMLLISALIGATYAIYTVSMTGNQNVITTGVISMSYTESTNVISIENALPKSDIEGQTQEDSFNFSITSNLTLKETDSDKPIIYTLELEKLDVDEGYQKLNDNQIKIYLENTDTDSVLKLSLASDLYGDSVKRLYATTHNHKYGINSIRTNYRLRVWIDYSVDASNWSGTNYEYKFRVNVNTEVSEIGYESLYNKIASQVRTANISYRYINGANKIINNVTYNSDDNGVFLFNGTDDNGGSNPIYYYRGNVTNNNVLFANSCWKIVRTTSSGGVKLIYNGKQLNGTCDNIGSDTQYAVGAFNLNYTSPADVGYMYGTRFVYSSKVMTEVTDTYLYGNDVTYDSATNKYTLTGKTTESVGSNWNTDKTTIANGYHYTCLNSTGVCEEVYYITYFQNGTTIYYLTFTNGDNLDTAKEKMFSNINDSVMKNFLENTFFTSVIKTTEKDYSSYLENNIFCYDRTLSKVGNYGGALLSKDINATNYNYFTSKINVQRGTPSLQCEEQRDQFSLSTSSGGTSGYGNNTLKYSVGLITYDEALLAGAESYTSNNNYYLYTGQNYWIGSPFNWHIYYSYLCGVYASGALTWYYYSPLSLGIRPSLSLKSGIIYVFGDGTVTNPYVISV